MWDDVAADLSRDGTVWTPDATPAVGDPTPQRSLAVDIAARLREPVHLVGHSFGGQIALELALAAPELVTGLTVMCARATPFPSFVEHAATVRAGADVTRSTVDRWFLAEEVTDDGPVVRAARAAVTAADPAVYATAISAIAHFDRVVAARAVRVPTTVVAAEQDRGSPPEAMAELADAIPDAALVVLAGGHMSPFLRPAELADLVRRSAARAGGGADRPVR